MSNGRIRIMLKVSRLIRVISSVKFDFYELLPKDLSCDLDVKPKVFQCRRVLCQLGPGVY
jgi:hypothetical protein